MVVSEAGREGGKQGWCNSGAAWSQSIMRPCAQGPLPPAGYWTFCLLLPSPVAPSRVPSSAPDRVSLDSLAVTL